MSKVPLTYSHDAEENISHFYPLSNTFPPLGVCVCVSVTQEKRWQEARVGTGKGVAVLAQDFMCVLCVCRPVLGPGRIVKKENETQEKK